MSCASARSSQLSTHKKTHGLVKVFAHGYKTTPMTCYSARGHTRERTRRLPGVPGGVKGRGCFRPWALPPGWSVAEEPYVDAKTGHARLAVFRCGPAGACLNASLHEKIASLAASANANASASVPAPSPSPDFVPGLPHVILIESRQALVSYQDDHMLSLTLAGTPTLTSQCSSRRARISSLPRGSTTAGASASPSGGRR